MKINGFNFSPGNSKLGKIWNFSLPPIKSCPKGVPCANSKGCYAHKAYRLYPATRKAWDENLAALMSAYAQRDSSGSFYWNFFDAVWDLIIDEKPKYFRIHVAGDFIEQHYLNTWMDLASSFPKTKFLAFTKNTELDYSNPPKNLKIRFSMWPGWDPYGFNDVDTPWTCLPKAWMDDGVEEIPEARVCKNSCVTCKYCWNSDEDVVFKKH